MHVFALHLYNKEVFCSLARPRCEPEQLEERIGFTADERLFVDANYFLKTPSPAPKIKCRAD